MSFTAGGSFDLVKRLLQDSKINSDVYLSACKNIISSIYDGYSFPFFNDSCDFTNTTADVNYVQIPTADFANIKKINALFFDEVKPENRKRKINHNILFSTQTTIITQYNDTIKNGYLYFDANLAGNEKIIIFYKKILDLSSFALTTEIPLPDDFRDVFESGITWKLCPFSREPLSQNSMWYNMRDNFKNGLSNKIKDYSISNDNTPIINTTTISNELNNILGGFYDESEIFI